MIARRRMAGLSLIELMIAMVIGLILMAGLLQVFAASRSAARMAEGFSRVQENARFALDFLQRDLRMVGHMGCVNDQARMLSGASGFANRLDPARPELVFTTGIEGFEATNTGASGAIAIPETPGGTWTGSNPLPGYIADLDPLPGSDIVVLRYFSPEGIPVENFTAGSPDSMLKVDRDRWDEVIENDGFENPSLLGIADCLSAHTFQATEVDGAGNVKVTAGSGLNAAAGLGDAAYVAGQTVLYRAEAEVFFVGLNGAAIPQPSLYRARFTAEPNGALQLVGGGPEELVEGIESLQLLYGMDNQKDLSRPPTGFIAAQETADGVTGCAPNPANPALDCWNRVGLVRVALLSRSTERASSTQPVNLPNLLGATLTLPDDGRYRAVYQSTIALRNRLYGN